MSTDTVNLLIKFEQGETTNVETLELFSELVKYGAIRSLQGSYYRQFLSLVDGQFLTPDGEITEWGRSMAEDIDEGIAEGEAAEAELDEGYDEHVEEETRQGELAADARYAEEA